MKQWRSAPWCIALKRHEAFLDWDRVATLLRPAIEKSRGGATVDDIYEMVMNDEVFIMVMGIAEEWVLAVAFAVHTTPQYKVLDLLYVGGKHAALFFHHYSGNVKEFARNMGCQYIQGYCGDAELRLFSRMAKFEKLYTVIRVKA